MKNPFHIFNSLIILCILNLDKNIYYLIFCAFKKYNLKKLYIYSRFQRITLLSILRKNIRYVYTVVRYLYFSDTK